MVGGTSLLGTFSSSSSSSSKYRSSSSSSASLQIASLLIHYSRDHEVGVLQLVDIPQQVDVQQQVDLRRHKVLQAAGKDCRGVLHRPIGPEVSFDTFLPRIIIINNNKTAYSSSSGSEIASPHFSFPSQMVQDWRHRRDRQVWRCQDCRQEEGPGQASIRRVSHHHHRHHIDTNILA